MRTLILVTTWILLAGPVSGRAEMPSRDAVRNTVFVELGGPGLFYSLNYDRALTEHVSGRVGLGIWTVNLLVIEARARLIPVTASYLIGTGGSRGEFGAGLVLGFVGARAGSLLRGFGTEEDEDLDLSPIVGLTGTAAYRYQPREGGFALRLGLTPLYFGYKVIPWVALSVGYAF